MFYFLKYYYVAIASFCIYNKCLFIVTPIFISFIVDMTNDDDDLRHTAT